MTLYNVTTVCACISELTIRYAVLYRCL